MTTYTITGEQLAQLKAARMQFIDLGDQKSAAMLAWVDEAEPDKPKHNKAWHGEFADWMLHGIEIAGEAATGFKLNPAVRDVLVERQRQISVEGWTPEHDDAHSVGELARAAACYANPDLVYVLQGTTGLGWPWDESWWKPADQHRNLVKAGALILAAIARLYRAADKKES